METGEPHGAGWVAWSREGPMGRESPMEQGGPLTLSHFPISGRQD